MPFRKWPQPSSEKLLSLETHQTAAVHPISKNCSTNRSTWMGMETRICSRFELDSQSDAHLLHCHLKLLPEKRPNNSQALQSHKTNKKRSSNLSYVSLQSVQHRRCKRGFKDGLVFVDRILRNAISLTTTFLKDAITGKNHQTSAAHLTSKTRSTNHSAWIGMKNKNLRTSLN